MFLLFFLKLFNVFVRCFQLLCKFHGVLPDLLEKSIIFNLQLFNSVFNAFNVQFELLLHSDVLSNVCFQVLNELFVDFWALRIAKFTKT